jgi:hypothetical protein
VEALNPAKETVPEVLKELLVAELPKLVVVP